jgi:hypothetical protein
MSRAHHDRWPKPSELAAVLAFVVVADDAALISGAAIPVYGRAQRDRGSLLPPGGQQRFTMIQ